MRFFVAICVIFAQIWAFGIEDLHSIKRDNIKGDFVQSKKLRGFKNALVSYGNFSIINDELFWDTTKPVISHIKITADGIFSLQNGEWVATSQNYDRSLFLSIIRLDLGALQDSFDFVINGDKDAWQLSLLPKGVLKNVFRNIEISGGEFVSRVILVESNGDFTENIFSVK